MSTRLITAYYMHEGEREAAKASMSEVLVTAAFVHGEIDDAQIEDLRSQGLFVEVHDDDPYDDDEAAPASAADHMEADAGFIEGLESTGPDPFAARAPAETGFYTMRLRRPLLPDDHAKLGKLGVEVIERVCPVKQVWEDPGKRLPERREFKVRLTGEQVDAVRRLDFVRSVHLYDTDQTPVLESPDHARRSDPPERLGVESDAVDPGLESVADAPAARTFDVILHRPADEHAEDRDAVLEWLGAHGVPVIGTARRKIRVELDPALEGQVRALHEVAFL
ncbi:MAG TPA: hypothetical protein VFY65_02115, partial [Longimicrobium sp.]|nr:hypothetical protein [Longimicrobium sp.]